jgi:hypothetical protein
VQINFANRILKARQKRAKSLSFVEQSKSQPISRAKKEKE